IERLLGVHFRWNDFDDFYPYVSGGWVFMELAAIAAAAAALARYRRPFLMLPLTLFTGFLAMDASTRAWGGWDHYSTVEHADLAAGTLFAWAALGISAHGAAFPFLLMLGSIGFIATAIWLARVDSPLRRWLATRSLPAPQRDLVY